MEYVPSHGEDGNKEYRDIPSRRSGRAIGEAKATATRDKMVMTENCMMTVID